MKVKMLRLIQGCYALRSADLVNADKNISIEMVGNGNFLVNDNGKMVFLPSTQVHFAICEADGKPETKK